MDQNMCALIIVCCLGSNMPNMTIVPFVIYQDGKINSERRLHKSVVTSSIGAPRIKRMSTTKEASEEAQWHKLKWKLSQKEMSHLDYSEAWQDFDREFLDFAKDARNLRLVLATNSFVGSYTPGNEGHRLQPNQSGYDYVPSRGKRPEN
jgi:hypothetical protein